MKTHVVENFPGFPEGVVGSDLMEKLQTQAKKFGTEMVEENVTKVDTTVRPFVIHSNSKVWKARAVIVATGANAKLLSFPGFDRYWNSGISACAVCDGALPIFRKQVIAVVGGGDSAMEEALFLSKYASKVVILHRSSAFRASKIMQSRVLSDAKIEVRFNHEVVQAYGDDFAAASSGSGSASASASASNEKKTTDGESKEQVLQGLKLRNTQTKEQSFLAAHGLFIAIGHEPASAFLKGQLKTDSRGYVLVQPGTTRSSVDGVFCAGDVADPKYRQAITAAGSGCQAAIETIEWLAVHATKS